MICFSEFISFLVFNESALMVSEYKCTIVFNFFFFLTEVKEFEIHMPEEAGGYMPGEIESLSNNHSECM